MFFSDRLTLDKPRRNADGFMAIHARAARTGVYQYLGREIDPEGKHFAADQIVNVYRPPEEVFDKASLGSFVGKPITDDHPSEAVTATNWRDLARGTTMSAKREVADDGEYVGFDLAFMDADLITKIDSGKRELSNGYAARLDVEDGTAPDGTEYQAVQREIRGNHVAVVDAGRAGSSCRIGDAQPCAPIPSDEVKKFLVDQRTYDAARVNDKNNSNKITVAHDGDAQVDTKTIIVDGLQVLVTDAAEAAILKLQGQLKDANEAKDKALADVATLKTDKAGLEAEKVKLEGDLKDAQITPEKLRDAAKRFADVSNKAKAVGVTVADDADEMAIMKAVVSAKMGDAAKDYDDAAVSVAFAALTKDAKIEDQANHDPLRDGISQGVRPLTDTKSSINDARRHYLNRKESAYLGAAN